MKLPYLGFFSQGLLGALFPFLQGHVGIACRGNGFKLEEGRY